MGKKQKKGQIGAFICGFIIFVIFIFPLYWMVVTALKTQVEIFEIPTPLWPRNLSLDAFKAQLSASSDTLRGFKNSAIIAVGATIISTVLSIPASYGLARFRFRAKKVMILFFLIIGLFWKRNTGLAVATMALTWIVTNVWTFTSLPAVLGMENINMIWIILAITLIMQIIGNLILPGRKGYFRSDDWFESEQFAIYEREKHGLSEVE